METTILTRHPTRSVANVVLTGNFFEAWEPGSWKRHRGNTFAVLAPLIFLLPARPIASVVSIFLTTKRNPGVGTAMAATHAKDKKRARQPFRSTYYVGFRGYV